MNEQLPETDWEKLTGAKARTGISISELYRLCITEQVVSVHMVKPGKGKGIRLISKKSLDAYIASYLPGGTRYQAKATQMLPSRKTQLESAGK